MKKEGHKYGGDLQMEKTNLRKDIYTEGTYIWREAHTEGHTRWYILMMGLTRWYILMMGPTRWYILMMGLTTVVYTHDGTYHGGDLHTEGTYTRRDTFTREIDT